uniref:Helitron helicase-like domain-containing protein n=2 Tax=Parascaris TaxID=6254 RepID=A0A915AQM1_PARUN
MTASDGVVCCLPIKWWMYIVATLFILSGAGSVSSALAAPSQGVRINNLIYGVAFIVTAIFTIGAASTEKSMLLIPYLIAEVYLLFFYVCRIFRLCVD